MMQINSQWQPISVDRIMSGSDKLPHNVIQNLFQDLRAVSYAKSIDHKELINPGFLTCGSMTIFIKYLDF